GKIQDGIEKQVTQVFKNIGQVLKAGGMGFKDVVKVNVFLTDSRFIPTYRSVRDQFISEPYPASTLLVIAGLADPAMLVEVEVVGGAGNGAACARPPGRGGPGGDCARWRTPPNRRCLPRMARPSSSKRWLTAFRFTPAKPRARATNGSSRRPRPACSTARAA